MSTNRRWRALRLALLAGILGGCSGGDGPTQPPPPPPPVPPVPGVLTVSLTTPNANDRAARLTITGSGPITQVELAGSGLVLHQRTVGQSVHVAVFGPLTSGPLLRFSVPDVNRMAAYAVTIPEVADQTNALRADLAGYTATLSK